MGQIVEFRNFRKTEYPKPILEWNVDDFRYFFYYMAENFSEDEAWDYLYERILERAGER